MKLHRSIVHRVLIYIPQNCDGWMFNDLIEVCGGVTAYPAEGGWFDPSTGDTIVDEVAVHEFWATGPLPTIEGLVTKALYKFLEVNTKEKAALAVVGGIAISIEREE